MKTFLPYLYLLLLIAGPLPAQTPPAPPGPPVPAAPVGPTVKIEMRDGTSRNVTSLRRSGASVIVPLGDGKGEVGVPVTTIARINFPEPRQIAESENLLVNGKSAEALALIDPIATFFAPFRDIAGSFWTPAAFLKMKVLLALGRTREATDMLDQIAAFAKDDPLLLDRIKVEKAAVLTRAGKNVEAITVYDEIIEKSTDPETLANAWAYKGRSLLAEKNYDAALLAFLHLPVFYGNETLLQPMALLGSGQAYLGLEDSANAQSAFQQILDQFPKSPEAAEADKQIKLL